MAGNALWIVLLGAAVALELFRPAQGLIRALRNWCGFGPIRFLFALGWGFVGWHLFTRYGIAPK